MTKLEQMKKELGEQLQADAESKPDRTKANEQKDDAGEPKKPKGKDEKETDSDDKKTKDKENVTSGLAEIGRILDTSEKVEMALLKASDNKDAAWLVIAEMKPLARIVLTGQNEPNKIAAYFVSAEYRSAILDAGERLGWEKALAGANAQVITDGKIVAAADTSRSEEEIKKKAIREFSQSAELVIKAFSKNLIDPNPLKASLYEVFTEAGIENPQTKVEAVFAEGGEELISTIIDKSLEWMNLESSVREQLARSIGDLGTKTVTADSADDEPDDEEPVNLAAQLEANSVPLTTAAKSEGNDFKTRVRSAYGKDQ